ncbi:MAG: DUF2834 domain-containing protein [Scytolyngbya sp. HA4215-MV1]|nr:DUF2834 domain-containing protein [Scytolyngbya sp. HA4215-MV1]
MIRKIALWLLWLCFTVYAFFLAPANQPNTFELIKNLSIRQWQGINPLVIALFYIMGVLPMMYGSLLLIDGRGQKLPAWLFVIAAFGVGAFAVVPYLALRDDNPTFSGTKNPLLNVLDARWTGSLLLLSALGLIFYGLTQGNWADFVQQWQHDRFIHVMSLDFCLLSLLFPTLLGDDMARRGIDDRRIFWAVTLIPLLGTACYLALRPPLSSTLNAMA